MDVRDLAYFHAILQAGSVVAAAGRVGRTPPALTKAVRRLEDDLGVPLFRRVGRGLEPTGAARFLAEQTAATVAHLDTVGRQVRDVAAGRRGHLRLGVAATMAAIFLPAFMRRLGAEHPDLRVSVVNGMNDVLHTALRAGEIDLVLGVVDRTDPDLTESLVLAQDNVRIAAAAHHPLQGRALRLDEVLGQTWVLPSRRVAMRQWFDAAFAAQGLRAPIPHVETSSIAVLEELIAETGYLSFISGLKMQLPAVAHRIAPLAIEGFAMPRQMGATWTHDPAPATRIALSLLKDVQRNPQSNSVSLPRS